MINWSEYPSKLPPDFKRRVLARLLPSADVIRRATPAQLIDLQQKRREIEKAIDAEPIRFFLPNPGAQADFLTESGDRLRHKYFLAGNKSGKSTGAAILAAEYATGEVLWGRDFRSPLELSFPVPNRGVYYADDFDSHKQTTLPTLFTWLPRRLIRDADRGSTGHIVDLYLTNGSVINFRTYEQGYDKSEGKDWAWGVCDEPPPRDIYTGIRRGLVVYDGVLIIAATLLKEPWIWDEVEHSGVRVYTATIYNNEWIPSSSRDEFVESLTNEEREVRVHGRPITLSGVVYTSFRDDRPWIVPTERRYHDPIKEPPWPVVMGVDPHERRPLHIGWFWLTPDERLIMFDWALVASGRGVEGIFEDLDKIESEHDQRTKIVVMDPNRGNQVQLGGRTWQSEFEDHGFQVMLGDDQVQMGHADVRDALNFGESCGPMLTFQDCCRGKNGPIYQMLRYAWDDWIRANRMLRDPKERVREQYKDYPDIIRYVVRAVKSGLLDFELLTESYDRRAISIMQHAPRGRSLY